DLKSAEKSFASNAHKDGIGAGQEKNTRDKDSTSSFRSCHVAVMRQVLVTIQADAINGKRYRWRDEVSIDSSASSLKAKWAEATGVPEKMVEFFDAVTELPVKLDLTPSQLGWAEAVTLLAVPADDEGAASPPDAQTLGRKRRRTEARGEPLAAHTKDPPAARPAVAEPAAPKPAPATSAAARVAPKSKPAEAPAKAGSAKPAPKPSPGPAPPNPKAKGPPASAKAAPGPAKAGAPGGPKSKQEDDATKLVDLLGSLPGQDEPIKYAENPKRPGTSAHARYEKYKHAKTIAEALKCGAAKGDIDHDFKNGFLRRA
ncbi:unnamed protein product, partial [Symbiodinium necroappetens]